MGRRRAAAARGEGWVVVVPVGARAHRETASLEPGEIRIRLARGFEVEGVAVVDGHVPRTPVRLRFSPETRGEEIADLPLDVRREARDVAVLTDERGGFRFRGLPEGLAGNVVIPFGYRFEGQEGRFRVRTVVVPTRGLRLRLHRAPFLTGRVVQSGAAVASAGVNLHYVLEAGGGGSTYVSTDAEGRFHLDLPETRIRSALLKLTGPGGSPETTLELDPDRLRGDHDLGDLRLPETRVLTVIVTDADARPVIGAAVVCGDATGPRTDAEGRTSMEVPAGEGTLRVGALGTRVVEVDLATVEGDRVEVTLPPGNLLRVRVVDSGGVPANGVFVTLFCRTAWIFAGNEGGSDRVHSAAGGSRPLSGSWSGEDGTGESHVLFRPDAEGWVRLSGIRPGATIRVRVADVLSRDVLAEKTVTLGEDEQLDCPFRVEAGRELRGMVVDRDGKPLARARVWVERGFTSTGQDGRFTVPGIRGAPLSVQVRCAGFATFADANTPLPEPGKELRIVLGPGRNVLVSVVDRTGRSVDSAWVTALVPGFPEPEQTEEQGEGRFLLEDLPEGTVTITAVVAGKTFEIAHDTARAEARVVVPALGAALVRFRVLLDKPVIHRIRLEPVGGEGVRVTADVHYWPDRAEGDVYLPAVFPGTYEAFLEYYDDEAEEDDVYAPFVGGARLEVKAGEKAEATLSR